MTQDRLDRIEKFHSAQNAVGGVCCACGCDREMTEQDAIDGKWFCDVELVPDHTSETGFTANSIVYCPDSW